MIRHNDYAAITKCPANGIGRRAPTGGGSTAAVQGRVGGGGLGREREGEGMTGRRSSVQARRRFSSWPMTSALVGLPRAPGPDLRCSAAPPPLLRRRRWTVASGADRPDSGGEAARGDGGSDEALE